MNHQEGHARPDASAEEILKEAERIFSSELERIASRFPLKREHLEDVLQNTGIRLGRDDITRYEEEKRDSEERVRKLTSSFFGKVCGAFAALAGRRALWEDIITREQGTAEIYQGLIDTCNSRSFAYDPKGRTIVIYPRGERRLDEDSRQFAWGILAEMGHAVIDSAGPHREGGLDLHDAVGEIYDLAFQLYGLSGTENLGSDALETVTDNLLYEMALADTCSQYRGQCGSIEEAAYSAASALYAGASPETDFDAFFQKLYAEFQRCASATEAHREGDVLALRLLRSMSKETGLSPADMLPSLMAVAISALYDPEVDFSSPESFLYSVETRLPDYLA